MKRFLMSHARVLGVLCTLFCLSQISVRADAEKVSAKVPKMTRDNFVSLTYESVKAKGGYHLLFSVFGNQALLVQTHRTNQQYQGSGLIYSGTPPYLVGQMMPVSKTTSKFDASLSDNQLKTLLKQINKTKFSALDASEILPEEKNQWLQKITLVMSDSNNRDRSFVAYMFKDETPQDFEATATYLRSMMKDKFYGVYDGDILSQKITLKNLESVSLETSGGFAGIKSSISIWPSSISSKPGIMWKQTIGGRDTEYFNILSDADFNHLTSMMNAAKISQLNGKKFEQVGLADGFYETLTVTLKDGRKFVVENYGDTAPPEYYAITRQLEIMKLGVSSQK